MSTAKKRELKKGDMIEFFRGNYQHWAVYIGDGEVVHLVNTSDPGAVVGISSSFVTNKGVVMRETLKSVAGNEPKWQINNYLDNEYEPRPADDIVRVALARVGEKKDYSLANYNCEHFATELRYGIPLCGQVKEVKEKATVWATIGAGLSGALSGAVSGVPSGAMVSRNFFQ